VGRGRRRAAVLPLLLCLALAACSSSAEPPSTSESEQWSLSVGSATATVGAATETTPPYSAPVTTGPFVGGPHVVRTDFSDDDAWTAVEIQTFAVTSEGFQANMRVVDDRAFAGMSADHVIAQLPPGYAQSFLVIADQDTITAPEHPLLVVDLGDPAHPQFRALPSTIQQIENNLSIANMDFGEFAGAVGQDGIFRGF
jgi:hypothetical protein